MTAEQRVAMDLLETECRLLLSEMADFGECVGNGEELIHSEA